MADKRIFRSRFSTARPSRSAGPEMVCRRDEIPRQFATLRLKAAGVQIRVQRRLGAAGVAMAGWSGRVAEFLVL